MIDLFTIGFIKVTLIDIIDILLVTWIFYKVYQYFKETRAGQMLIGLIILPDCIFFIQRIWNQCDFLANKPISNNLGCCLCYFIST